MPLRGHFLLLFGIAYGTNYYYIKYKNKINYKPYG